MGIFERFTGKEARDGDRVRDLIANPEIETPLGFSVLFADGPRLKPDTLTKALRSYHRSMSNARCDIDADLSKEGTVFGLAGWGKHVIKLVGFNLPMPAEALEACIAPSLYPQELKEKARQHGGHVVLMYAGYEPSPLEQYVALAAAAGALSTLGAIMVLNESAHTSLPAGALSSANTNHDIMDVLRAFPLPVLYCGMVKYEVERTDGVWMRTYGAHLLGLPDLAAHTAGHHEGQRCFDIFDRILGYMLQSGAALLAGHTMQLGDDEYLRFRVPTEDEYFLEGEGQLLVSEMIGSDQINR